LLREGDCGTGAIVGSAIVEGHRWCNGSPTLTLPCERGRGNAAPILTLPRKRGGEIKGPRAGEEKSRGRREREGKGEID
jgi:hypothetical protein